MRFPIGAMSVGDILDRGLRLFLARLTTFYAINLVCLTPYLVMTLVIPPFLMNDQTFDPRDLGNALPLVVGSFGVLGLTFAMKVLLEPVAVAACLHVVVQEFVGRRVGVGEAFRFTLGRLGSLILTSLLCLLIYAAGLSMCCAPALLFMTLFAFAPQAVLVENKGPVDALIRSLNLTDGYRLRVFGVIVLLFVLFRLIEAPAAALGFLLPPQEIIYKWEEDRIIQYFGPLNLTNHVLSASAGFLLYLLVQSLSAVCMTLLYIDLRIRKEGYDLELAARQQAGGET